MYTVCQYTLRISMGACTHACNSIFWMERKCDLKFYSGPYGKMYLVITMLTAAAAKRSVLKLSYDFRMFKHRNNVNELHLSQITSLQWWKHWAIFDRDIIMTWTLLHWTATWMYCMYVFLHSLQIFKKKKKKVKTPRENNIEKSSFFLHAVFFIIFSVFPSGIFPSDSDWQQQVPGPWFKLPKL